jgi:hypothetical protein
MVGIRAHPVADQLRQDVRAARVRLPDLLEHQDAGALSHDESVAAVIPGTARVGRIVVALRERAHRGKPRDAERRNARFGAAADHRIRVAPLDQPEGVPDRMRASGAGGGDRRVRALGAEAHGHVACREIDDRREDEEWRDAIGTPLEQRAMFPLDHLETADAAADHHPDARRVGGIDPETALLHRHRGGGDRELHEAGAFLHVLAIDPEQRVEPRHFPGEAGRVPRRIERGDRPNPGATGHDAGPCGGSADPERGHQADSSHDNSSAHSPSSTFATCAFRLSAEGCGCR